MPRTATGWQCLRAFRSLAAARGWAAGLSFTAQTELCEHSGASPSGVLGKWSLWRRGPGPEVCILPEFAAVPKPTSAVALTKAVWEVSFERTAVTLRLLHP